MARRTVAIVPHTHWDREWYSPFQTFRLRLVDLLDDFLPRLEADLSYARFMLDGQMAIVDDYLAVRPENEPVLRRLAATGRITMGPWYTLPDEFLVSGETHIRNLQLGLERAVHFGGAMEVGYLPDMFGHVAQMPQVLRLFGFEHAVVWRGVPSAVDRTAFLWRSPDGSEVRAQYLPSGYGNGAAVPDDAKALVRRVAAHEAELGEMLAGDMLFMNGTDHQVPQSWLGRVVEEANEIQDEYRLVVTSLPEFLSGSTTDGLPTWTGELRSGARSNLLMGVASNRVDVKQAAARAERALERMAEPLCALFLDEGRWPGALLATAWKEMLRNAAHDSICACSVDEVVDAVLHRYAEARQIGDGLADRALRALATSIEDAGHVVVNPSARTRGGVVEIIVSDLTPVPGAQVLASREAGSPGTRDLQPSDLAAMLGQIQGQRFTDTFFVNAIDVEEDDAGVEVVLRLATTLVENPEVEEARRELYTRLGEHHDARYRVRVERPPMQRLLVRVEDVEGFGWTTWSRGEAMTVPPVRAEGLTLDNGLSRLEVDPVTGTFILDGVQGLDRFVDGGDQGDTYNYCPPASDRLVDTPDEVEVVLVESGPVRGAIAVKRTFSWPERIEDARGERTGVRPTTVTTLIELYAGERIARVHTTFDNQSRDHRLRSHFPLPQRASASRAECAFAIVERGLEAEGGPTELPLATFPSRRFVSAGGLTVAHEGLLEYELVDDGRTLAITLLRGTAMLSRGPMTTRPQPAGPPIRTEGSQMLGPVAVRYAVSVGDANPYELVDQAFLPLRVVTARGGGQLTASGTALEVEGAEVSAVVRRAGLVEVRVFNPSPTPTSVRFAERAGWVVDLRGRPINAFNESFDLGPWAIATARLT